MPWCHGGGKGLWPAPRYPRTFRVTTTVASDEVGDTTWARLSASLGRRCFLAGCADLDVATFAGDRQTSYEPPDQFLWLDETVRNEPTDALLPCSQDSDCSGDPRRPVCTYHSYCFASSCAPRFGRCNNENGLSSSCLDDTGRTWDHVVTVKGPYVDNLYNSNRDLGVAWASDPTSVAGAVISGLSATAGITSGRFHLDSAVSTHTKLRVHYRGAGTLRLQGKASSTAQWVDYGAQDLSCPAGKWCFADWTGIVQEGNQTTASVRLTTTAGHSAPPFDVLVWSSDGGGSVAGPPAGSCTLPWGGFIDDGASVNAYQSSYPPSGACPVEVRVCVNGLLSGGYVDASCSCTTVVSGTSKVRKGKVPTVNLVAAGTTFACAVGADGRFQCPTVVTLSTAQVTVSASNSSAPVVVSPLCGSRTVSL